MSRYFPGSRTSAQIVVSLEEKYHNVCPSSFSSLLTFTSEQMLYGTEYPFGQLGSSALAVTLPKILPTPIFLGRVALLGYWRDGPGAVGALPSRTRTWVCCPNLSRHQCKAQTWPGSQPEPIHHTDHLGFLPMFQLPRESQSWVWMATTQKKILM